MLPSIQRIVVSHLHRESDSNFRVITPLSSPFWQHRLTGTGLDLPVILFSSQKFHQLLVDPPSANHQSVLTLAHHFAPVCPLNAASAAVVPPHRTPRRLTTAVDIDDLLRQALPRDPGLFFAVH
jgi:hypothetical protein